MKPSRVVRALRVVAALVAGIALGLGALAWHDTSFTRLHEVELVNPKVSSEGLRILQITDFHSLPNDRQVDRIVALAAEASPDVVAITGDLVTTQDADYTQVERLFAGLARTHNNVFVIWGNHDHWNHGGLQRLHALVEKYRFVLLDNTSLPLDGPWGSLDVIGTDDYYIGQGDLPAALVGTRPEAFRLVLTHSPDAEQALRGSGVDLAICGHTHGGQIRLPGIGALYIPGEWWPEYHKGAYDLGGVPLYIDSGVGTTGPQLRLFNQSQITLYEVRPG